MLLIILSFKNLFDVSGILRFNVPKPATSFPSSSALKALVNCSLLILPFCMMLKASSPVLALATKSLPLLLNIPVETALIPNNADEPPKISDSVAPKGFPSNATCPVTSSTLGLAPGIVTSASIPISSVTLSRFAISSGLNPKKDGVVFAMLYIIKSDTLSELAPVMSLTLRSGLFNSSSVNFV